MNTKLRPLVTRHDQGTVTAEFAVLLPMVTALALLILALTRTVIVGLNCQEAARAAARELIISNDTTRITPVVQSIAGRDATVSMSESHETITIATQCPIAQDFFGVLPVKVSGRAVAMRQEAR